MSKISAGITTFTTLAVIPVEVTKFRTSNGRVYDSPVAANKAQARINDRAYTAAVRKLLNASGATCPSSQYSTSLPGLVKALRNPKLVAKLVKAAKVK